MIQITVEREQKEILIKALEIYQTLFKELSDNWADIEELKNKIKEEQ